MALNLTVLVVFILLLLGLMYALFRGVWKDKAIFIEAYKSMESFKKASLEIGLAYYIILPLLESHPSRDTYISQVSIEILSALANALFILGALAFLENGHHIYKQNNNEQSPNKRLWRQPK